MKIASVRHKALRKLIEADDASGLPSAAIEKIRNILSFLQDMDSTEELRALPHWRAHRLGGDRRGTWSLSVTRNWRITFGVAERAREKEIVDLDFEDYH
jgi:proteic killer suppression protein